MRLLAELQRRNVFRMAVLYVVAAWLIMQVAEVIIGLANLADWIGPGILVLLAVGFPIAIILSWFYELTPAGIALEMDVEPGASITHVTGRRMDFVVIALLAAAVILFSIDKWWPRGPMEQSIAVLPFENMSANPEQEYFSDGISEDLLNLLAQIPELRVISRSSAFSFKGKDVDIPTVAQQLNVAHVLEGSVRREGDRVRITAQLIDARTDSHLWSESYDRELDDVFAVQDEIAAAISDALKTRLVLVEGEAVQPTVVKAASTDAYDAYLRGRELIHLRGRENLEDAVRYLERSLRLDDNFAPAHAQLAIATAILNGSGTDNQVAIAHLDRAQALEPDLAEVHGGRALLANQSGDPDSAIEHARKALAVNPNYVDAMNWMRIALGSLGRYGEADAMIERLLISDPLNIVGRRNYAEHLARQGRIQEAHDVADQLVTQGIQLGYSTHAEISLVYEGKIAKAVSWALRRRLSRNSYLFHSLIEIGEFDEARRIDVSRAYWVDIAEGKFDDAIEATQRNLRLSPEDEEAVLMAAIMLYESGRIDEALPLFERALEFDVPDDRPISSPLSHQDTMRLAFARRAAGDEDGAQSAAQIVRQDVVARRAAGRDNRLLDEAEAMLAAFDGDQDRAFAALTSAVERGEWSMWIISEPAFRDYWDQPPFIELGEKLEQHIVAEHNRVLQLICFNNPAPDHWQPMPETCHGIERIHSQ